MSWLAQISRRLSRAPRAQTPSTAVTPGSAEWFSLGGAAGSVSEASALAVSAVYASVNLIAGALAAMPVKLCTRAEDGDLIADPQDPLWWVLNEAFAPRWPASAGWSFLGMSRLLHGDAYAEIVRGPGGRIEALVPIHPRRVRAVVTPDGLRLIYEVQPDPTIERPDRLRAQMRVLDQDDMLHVAGFGFDGRKSASPLQHALRMTVGVAAGQQDFSAAFFRNAARPELALKTAMTMSPEQIGALRRDFEVSHAGAMNTGRPLILHGGLEVQTLTMPLEDMQLLEARKFSVEEIARVYGVPPFMIGHTEKTSSWGTGVESMGRGFVRFTLQDHLNAFSNEINRKFFRRPDRVALFDTSALERADTKAMFEAARIALGRAGEPAFMGRGEARHWLGLPRDIPAGDVVPDPAPASAPAQEPAA